MPPARAILVWVALAATPPPGKPAAAAVVPRGAPSSTQSKKATSTMRKFQVGDQKGLDSLQLVDGPVAAGGDAKAGSSAKGATP